MKTLLRSWTPDVDADDVLRQMGADPEGLRKRSPRAADAADRAAHDGAGLVTPSALQRRFQIIEHRHEKLKLSDGGRLSGRLVARHLAGAREVIAVVCSIGSRIEATVSENIRHDPAYALALDQYGTLAVGSLVRRISVAFREEADREGLHVTIPLSPGMDGWSTDVGQRQMFGLLDAPGNDVQLTESSYMVPRKSTSFLLGLGTKLSDEVDSPCDCCSLRSRCSYRNQYG